MEVRLDKELLPWERSGMYRYVGLVRIAYFLATGYGLDDRGGRNSSPGRVKNFQFSTSSRPVVGSAQPPIRCLPGALSLGTKRPLR
jgi:hypothetical protein